MFNTWRAHLITNRTYVDIESEEELYASFYFEAGVPLPKPEAGLEYLATVLNGEETTIEQLGSEVAIDVPDGVQGILWRKIHTEFSLFKNVVPGDECMVGPVVELYLIKGGK